MSDVKNSTTRDIDLQIVRRVVAGDLRAFEELMRHHNRRLYRLARATLRNDADAEDALQEAYLQAFRTLGQFRGDAALGTWLARLVLNECLGRLRRDARRQGRMPILSVCLDEDLMFADMDATCFHSCCAPDQEASRAEFRRLLERKLDSLPIAFRTVFVLRTVEEMSIEETAQMLGIAEATVRSRHFRARVLLRASLAEDLEQSGAGLFEFGGKGCDRIVAAVLARLDISNSGMDRSRGGDQAYLSNWYAVTNHSQRFRPH
ncbi:RNA polymerase sigma factor [Paraburkholderia unamae]|uniref:RNA polymerase sigma-70 factor (ECF subfamily) n=1 Tax=Paraburkholderia unamae TaxID=219649 RepID=A0ABX5KTH0_9BURK|nr:RNA polymerase sigma factor [Paraburkholderia unamae]PVX85564.1 RNA polymerase sigma-70 factor (ECF subfamily) [Paraburkholderia unamae]RAR55227.1 RNA polymerase sigma-70 factor (ECF subfamily) [Paraburkholderia unamae]CAG9268125.1 RNA polymerase sigma factor RpoE [Paraburkholderia unamae]